MYMDNNVAQSGDEIANLLADQFRSVYSNIPINTFSNDHNIIVPSPNVKYLSKIHFSESDIKHGIKNLNELKGAGPDLIPPLFVKRCGPAIVLPLTLIFNRSLAEGIFPDEWKKARIVPVHKKGDQANAKNYRPISILSCLSKLFESTLHPIITNLVDDSISDFQHGFRSGRSVLTNLVSFISDISKEVDTGAQVDAIYTDFSSAFDKVNHSILLQKLQAFGVGGTLLNWFRSYLHNRPQNVVVNGFESHTYFALSGVPQGSHLGPVLFLIFIDDLTARIKHCKMSLFADDLKIYNTVKSASDSKLIQDDINEILDWCNLNCMRLNVNKCFHIKYTRKKKPLVTEYEIGGALLSEVQEIRDLGVIIDQKLTFVSHIDKIVTKSAQMLGFLRRNTVGFKNLSTKVLLFNNLVRSNLEYASVAWSPFYAVHTQRVENIQRAFTRHLAFSCSGFSHRSPYDLRLSKFKMTTLRYRRRVHDFCFLHKLINNQVKCSHLLKDVSLTVPHSYPRHKIKKLFHTPFSKTNLGLQAPLSRILDQFNIIQTREAGIDIFHDSFNSFKRKLHKLCY